MGQGNTRLECARPLCDKTHEFNPAGMTFMKILKYAETIGWKQMDFPGYYAYVLCPDHKDYVPNEFLEKEGE